MPNTQKKFIPNYNTVTLQEIADAAEFSLSGFYRWRKKHGIDLSGGRVNYVEQQLIYQKLYGEKYDENGL